MKGQEVFLSEIRSLTSEKRGQSKGELKLIGMINFSGRPGIFLVILVVLTIFIMPLYLLVADTNSSVRTWLGPDFYASQSEDWMLSEGKIECRTGAPNRYVYFLTREIDPAGQQLDISFRAAVPALPEKIRTRNYLAVRLGIKGEGGDFREAAVRGQGLDLGLTTEGLLFIGELESVSSDETLEIIKKAMEREIEFRVRINREGQASKLRVSVINPDTGKVLDELEDLNLPAEKIRGGMALVASFPEAKPTGSVPVCLFYDLRTEGDMLKFFEERKFGPVAFTLYTISRKVLRLSAQMIPGSISPDTRVLLEIQGDEGWEIVSEREINTDTWQAFFRVSGWPVDRDVPFRIRLEKKPGQDECPVYSGVIRKEPHDKEKIRLAVLGQNQEQSFPHAGVVSALKEFDPDILFFAGNQVYGRPLQFWREKLTAEQARREYFRQWLLFGWAFSDLLKEHPAVLIPEARDFFQLKLWGEGGKPSAIESGSDLIGLQDGGGFLLPEEFIKLVLLTQTAHLPADGENNSSDRLHFYGFSEMNYAGLSLAVVNDRINRSAPVPMFPEAQIRNGWPLNPSFDPKKAAGLKEARLFSSEQLERLRNWVVDWTDGAWMKALLTSGAFVSLITLPEGQAGEELLWQLAPLRPGEYPVSDVPVADFNSGGWPQPARDEIISLCRKALAVHVCGSGGPPAALKYGLNSSEDAVAAMVAPPIQASQAIRWAPTLKAKSMRVKENLPSSIAEDAFGNKFSVMAVTNPVGDDRISGLKSISGFGLVTFEEKSRQIIFESYRLDGENRAELMPGWPVVIRQIENDGRKPAGYLPLLKFSGMENPVVQVVDERTGEAVYCYRISGTELRPPVFRSGIYSIRCGEPGTEKWRELKALKPQPEAVKKTIQVDFTSSLH